MNNWRKCIAGAVAVLPQSKIMELMDAKRPDHGHTFIINPSTYLLCELIRFFLPSTRLLCILFSHIFFTYSFVCTVVTVQCVS